MIRAGLDQAALVLLSAFLTPASSIHSGFFFGRRTRITAAYDSSAGNRGNASLCTRVAKWHYWNYR